MLLDDASSLRSRYGGNEQSRQMRINAASYTAVTSVTMGPFFEGIASSSRFSFRREMNE